MVYTYRMAYFFEQKLWDAAESGDLQGINFALSMGADINWNNANWIGCTPLMRAASSGQKESVLLLLENGANPTVTNDWDSTALSYAEDRGHNEIAEIIRVHSAFSALKKGMKEGYVTLHNTKITICGPPCVGKTAFNALLFNQPPPLIHNSTPIAARPVQAIERISAKGKIWKKITEEDLLITLSDAILSVKQETEETDKIHTEPDTISALEEQSIQVDAGAANQSLPEVTGSNLTGAAEKILQYLKSPQEGNHRMQAIHEANWIHLLDSGGQPQFSDMLRVFNRGNSLYVIVMKVTESLHDKPTFVYSINGKPLSTPTELAMTNLQIIESFVRSVAASSNCVLKIGGKNIATKPVFVIVATHCDQSKFKRLLGVDETLKKKNSELQSRLNDFLDFFIFYNRDSNELIFPVDNLCMSKRDKVSADIRQRIMSHSDTISFSVPIPVRWYLFEIKMKEEANSKNDYGMISLQVCYAIGIKLGMNRSDVDECLVYLDSLTLCIYYPSILHDVVFTNPQFLLDSLSNIVRLSFVKDIQQLLPEGICLSDDTQLLLKRDGVFSESLLDNLGLTFIPNLFTKADLISLLKHLYLISPISSSNALQYFFPIVLPPERITEEQKKAFTETCDPLIITFNSKLVLQGLFPTLIVSLINRPKKPCFSIDSRSPLFPKQLRYAIKLYSEDLFGSVILVDDYKFIEVYFTGNPKDCYHLRKVILEALSTSAKASSYNEEKLDISATTYCHRKHRREETDKTPHLITISYKRSPPEIRCSIETDLPSIELLNDRQSCWLIEIPVSSSTIHDFHLSSPSVPVSNVLPEGVLLNQSHAPVILTAIRDVVDQWELLGLYLGIENHKLHSIKYNSLYQVEVCRKDMICLWLETGSATRLSLTTALEDLGRYDIAAEVKRLPKH